MHTESLFATPFLYEHADKVDNVTLTAFCNGLYMPDSNKKNWQSDHLDLNNVILQPLLLQVQNMFNKQANLLGIADNCTIDVTQAWINVNNTSSNRSNTHEVHMHPGHIMSAVYYVQAPKDSGNLVLISPHGLMDYALPYKLVTNPTPFNGTRYTVMPSAGDLVSFPGWINHCVTENLSNQTRISIAFNGNLGGKALDDKSL
jgi:uncharacterized protein (TIGR02466 family)